MKICVAQTRPIKGDIQGNIESHKKLIDCAAAYGADTVIFPELSLTGYEPKLSRELATNIDDNRFDGFQEISETRHLTIGVGAPTFDGSGVCISMIIFQPRKKRQMCSKKYLHSDEEEYFVRGKSTPGLLGEKRNMALAICYELSVPEHSENAFRSGAEIYFASVAKTATGVERAIVKLSEIARKYKMTVLMANCVGESDGSECGGKSAVWDSKGLLVGQLDDKNEGILIFDTEANELVTRLVASNLGFTPT